ncbi:hypothetical protein Dimus_017344 [Dionaea muscipula]
MRGDASMLAGTRSGSSALITVAVAVAVIVIGIATVSDGFLTSRLLQSTNDRFLTTEEHWLDQTLDHFSPEVNFSLPIIFGLLKGFHFMYLGDDLVAIIVDYFDDFVVLDHRSFQQRYYEFLDHFRSPDGPIFLKICGESSCNGIPNDYVSVLAKKFGAAVVSLEHRYYGKSSPFKTLATENLRYLSSKQALFDLATFRQFYQTSLNLKRNRATAENPWFVFGVSYPGALSAWFRLKFPHLTCGSLASSAVVRAVYDFPEFDQQIGQSAGAECKAVLQEVTQLVEQRLETNQNAIKSAFGAAELTIDGDFMYFLADAAVMAFQYGNPDTLCSPIVQAKKAGQDLVDAYASYVKDYFLGSFGVGVEQSTTFEGDCPWRKQF